VVSATPPSTGVTKEFEFTYTTESTPLVGAFREGPSLERTSNFSLNLILRDSD
jgi:hypothetical protein